ncbi:MAG: alpha/beta fold hydrolase [Xenococcaceae cyanobacterium MO_167.B27]|nr:alpha/beta fold hydrolase [Xenococcaceae cyanobacterium MO_167.B27]
MTDSPQFYRWKDFRCAYTVHASSNPVSETPALVLVHPIGVGLSGIFWQRFIEAWLVSHPNCVIYNPDLLGCGASDMPSVAYYTVDWANQLKYFIENVVKRQVILVVQGALFPIAIKMLSSESKCNLIKGLVLSTPPAWRIITKPAKPIQQKLLWNLLFNSPVGLGKLFYSYARRRQFIESFSVRQLFANAEKVDSKWLDSLVEGAKDDQSRYAVFSFLAGFWLEDYTSAISEIKQPTLIVFGKQTSSISQKSSKETLQERKNSYLKHLPQAQISIIQGRNVLPVESTYDFVRVASDFLQQYNC